MSKEKNLFNIPTVKTINGKEYKFKQLTIYQLADFQNYCKELVKEEIKKDAKDAGIIGKDLLEQLNNYSARAAFEEKQSSIEGVIFLVKNSLKTNHNDEEIEEAVSSLTIDDMAIITTIIVPTNLEEENVKKTRPAQKKK